MLLYYSCEVIQSHMVLSFVVEVETRLNVPTLSRIVCLARKLGDNFCALEIVQYDLILFFHLNYVDRSFEWMWIPS